MKGWMKKDTRWVKSEGGVRVCVGPGEAWFRRSESRLSSSSLRGLPLARVGVKTKGAVTFVNVSPFSLINTALRIHTLYPNHLSESLHAPTIKSIKRLPTNYQHQHERDKAEFDDPMKETAATWDARPSWIRMKEGMRELMYVVEVMNEEKVPGWVFAPISNKAPKLPIDDHHHHTAEGSGHNTAEINLAGKTK